MAYILRIEKKIHKKIKLRAAKEETTMLQIIINALENYLKKEKETK